MRVTVDISMYPLKESYESHILRFIDHLHNAKGLTIVVNALTTQVQGEWDEVFGAIKAGIETYFGAHHRGSFVLKVLPGDIALDYRYQVSEANG